MAPKPVVFVASSNRAFCHVERLNALLGDRYAIRPWRDSYELMEGSLEALIGISKGVDFAIFVLTPDDRATVRGKHVSIPRDNVVFELGLFMGELGRDRVAVALDTSASVSLPTDLEGVTVARFDAAADGGIEAAAERLSRAIEKAGIRWPVTCWWCDTCFDNGEDHDVDYYLWVENVSSTELPDLSVHVFPENFILEPKDELKGRMHPSEHVRYRFRIEDEFGSIREDVRRVFESAPRESVVLRVHKMRTRDGLVFESSELGAQLWDKVQLYL